MSYVACFVCLCMKKEITIGFANLAVSRRKIKEDFFNPIDILLDWRSITKVIIRHSRKGAVLQVIHHTKGYFFSRFACCKHGMGSAITRWRIR